MVARTLHISLELELGGDRLTGRTSDGIQSDKTFDGWLGLMGALDALVAQERPAAGEGDPTDAAPSRPDAQENR